MLIPLLQDGIKVDGVDSSPDMLEICKDTVEAHGLTSTLYEQDLVDLSLPSTYKAIIMPAGSFCILPKEYVPKILKTFYDHLDEEGFIMVDVERRPSFQEGTIQTRFVPISVDLMISLTSHSDTQDWLAQKTTYINRYELVDQGSIIQTEIAALSLYWYEISEFEQLLSSSGYKGMTYELGYATHRPDPITFIAHK